MTAANIHTNTASLTNNYANELLQALQDICGVHRTLPETYQDNEKVDQSQQSARFNEITSPFLHLNIVQQTEDTQSADKTAPQVLSSDVSAEIDDGKTYSFFGLFNEVCASWFHGAVFLHYFPYTDLFASSTVRTS